LKPDPLSAILTSHPAPSGIGTGFLVQDCWIYSAPRTIQEAMGESKGLDRATLEECHSLAKAAAIRRC
jgi:hypothetical protein